VDRHGSRSHAARSGLQSAIASCALLAVLIAPLSVAMAAVLNHGLSRESLLVATIAGIVCWVAGAAALSISLITAQLRAPVHGVLLAMLFRMALPMAAIVIFTQSNHPLAAAGLAQTTLGVYLVTLVAETLITLRVVPATGSTKAT
jgi:hypothetical protein